MAIFPEDLSAASFPSDGSLSLMTKKPLERLAGPGQLGQLGFRHLAYMIFTWPW